MTDRIETIILYSLINYEEYARKVLPFIEDTYFSEKVEKILFVCIKNFINKYNGLPTKEALLINISNLKIKETIYEQLVKHVENELSKPIEKPELGWLIDKTEEWCKYRAIRNGILESVKIIDDPKSKGNFGEIPKILSDALSVGFSQDIGHDYFEDVDKQYRFYTKEDQKIPFDIDLLNYITNGGLGTKSLNIVVAGTGAGKSLFLTHSSAAWLAAGKNVLYITYELGEHDVVARIDANLLNIPKNELKDVSKDLYYQKTKHLRNKTNGKLIVHEFPTAGAHVGHIRALLNEIKLKKKFVPDVLVIDYLNIMSSFRIKQGSSVGLYSYVKAIAEEVRGLSMEFDFPILTASQLNRTAQTDTDVDFDGISDSHGTAMTADLIIALICTEELDTMNQLMIKQIKNRNTDIFKYRRFVVGVDRDYMRLYNVEQEAQKDITDSGQPDTPGFDKTNFGSRMNKNQDYSKLNFDQFSDDEDDELF